MYKSFCFLAKFKEKNMLNNSLRKKDFSKTIIYLFIYLFIFLLILQMAMAMIFCMHPIGKVAYSINAIFGP